MEPLLLTLALLIFVGFKIYRKIDKARNPLPKPMVFGSFEEAQQKALDILIDQGYGYNIEQVGGRYFKVVFKNRTKENN